MFHLYIFLIQSIYWSQTFVFSKLKRENKNGNFFFLIGWFFFYLNYRLYFILYIRISEIHFNWCTHHPSYSYSLGKDCQKQVGEKKKKENCFFHFFFLLFFCFWTEKKKMKAINFGVWNVAIAMFLLIIHVYTTIFVCLIPMYGVEIRLVKIFSKKKKNLLNFFFFEK